MFKARKLLFPFSIIYDSLTRLRNIFYNTGFFKVTSYSLPVICIGNLNTGGTGKTPMVEYLLHLLYNEFKVATLSRGYKRESDGFHYVQFTDTVQKSGDEPLQFKMKFPDALIAVDANRVEGIAELLKEDPDLILLDDAFQHRRVQAGLQILTTAYDNLYTEDFLLPAGNLRESARGAERADVIVISKSPKNISVNEREDIQKRLKVLPSQLVFFTQIVYSDEIKSKTNQKKLKELKNSSFCLVTGIANPTPFKSYLKKGGYSFKHLKFGDHHNFSQAEIKKLAQEPLILTTEKDYMRLKDHIPAGQLFYLPIKTEFIKGKEKFDKLILEFILKKKEVR